jgi:hypothetical protein
MNPYGSKDYSLPAKAGTGGSGAALIRNCQTASNWESAWVAADSSRERPAPVAREARRDQDQVLEIPRFQACETGETGQQKPVINDFHHKWGFGGTKAENFGS